MRHAFDKCGGSMGTSGCVSYMFDRKGVIVVEKADYSEDDMMMIALDAGAEDVVSDEDVFEIFTDSSDYSTVREALEANKDITILSSSIEMIPNNTVTPDSETQNKVQKLLDMLEDNDDVQNVYHNAEMDE